jgi:surface polysaccharide O-acyltransferase-like enzyme
VAELKLSADRLPFLDNLRSLMVVFVLIFHAGASYCAAVDFWPFHDTELSEGINLFLFLCDVFMMPVLFFIAGYFALPSFRKHGASKFMAGKLVRLGLPWLVITLLLLPALDYVHYVRNAADALAFPQFWLLAVKKIAEVRFGWIDMSRYLNMTENFYQRYMWYESLLLAMFAVFALLRRAGARLPKPSKAKAAAAVAAVMFALFTLARFTYPQFMDSGWFSFGNIIQFQLGKLAIYAACFTLGVFGFKGEWFKDKDGIGRPWIWLIVCSCLFGATMLVLKNVPASDNPAFGWKLGFCALYPLWTLSFAALFVSAAQRRLRRTNAFSGSIARNSYKMCLVHYIVPYLLPLALANTALPVLVKFGVAAVTTLVFSYGVSRFALGKLKL